MGKSIFAMRLALTYPTGADWPDGMPYDLPPGEVLWCEGESFLAGHRQRALQMGIPVNKILLPFANVTDGINDVRLGDPERQQAIEYYAITYNVKLIVVDSLSGTSSGDENQSTASAGVRWLAGLAQRTGVPVLLLHHLNKPGKDPTIGQEVTLGRVRGHTSIVQYARVIIAIDAPDAEKPEARRVSWIKSNLGQRPEPLGFTFADGQLAFTEAPRRQRPETLPERAGDLLLSLLASGPKPYAEVERQTEGAGFSLRTVQRAKEKLGILSEKRGEQWFWKLPHTEGIPKQDVF
jgi:putative DNA primase/helicase